MAFLEDHQQEAGIIYALSRKRVEEVADRLAAAGLKARAYHAGLGSKERKQVQEMFLRDDTQIVVATVAFGMGIDKPNVRFVVPVYQTTLLKIPFPFLIMILKPLKKP